MKAVLTAFLLFVVTTCATFGNLTNGVFYVDSAVECHLISQNGSVTTNQLTAGKTYMTSDVLVELHTTNKTTIYFSGGPMIETLPDSTLTINVFDQEVKNLDAQPRKAEFGSHNLGVTFNKGEFNISYPTTDANSQLTVNTPFATYQLGNGKFFYRVSDKSAIAYVLEGTMQMHGDKKVEKTSKGNLAVAIPFNEVEDKILTSIKTLKQDENDRYAAPVIIAEKKLGNVGFIVINGRVIGVWAK